MKSTCNITPLAYHSDEGGWQVMFGIGISELILIAVVALLFVGPKKLPDLAKQFGRFYVQARRAATDVHGLVDDVVKKAEDEVRLEERDRIKNLLLAGSTEIDSHPLEQVYQPNNPHKESEPSKTTGSGSKA